MDFEDIVKNRKATRQYEPGGPKVRRSVDEIPA